MHLLLYSYICIVTYFIYYYLIYLFVKLFSPLTISSVLLLSSLILLVKKEKSTLKGMLSYKRSQHRTHCLSRDRKHIYHSNSNESTEVQTLGVIRIQLCINILSKYSSLISHRCSKVDTSIIDLRRSTHRSSVFEGQHIHLRRSTNRSSKVDTSISEGRHILTSIFEGRHIDLRKSTHRS